MWLAGSVLLRIFKRHTEFIDVYDFFPFNTVKVPSTRWFRGGNYSIGGINKAEINNKHTSQCLHCIPLYLNACLCFIDGIYACT